MRLHALSFQYAQNLVSDRALEKSIAIHDTILSDKSGKWPYFSPPPILIEQFNLNSLFLYSDTGVLLSFIDIGLHCQGSFFPFLSKDWFHSLNSSESTSVSEHLGGMAIKWRGMHRVMLLHMLPKFPAYLYLQHNSDILKSPHSARIYFNELQVCTQTHRRIEKSRESSPPIHFAVVQHLW